MVEWTVRMCCKLALRVRLVLDLGIMIHAFAYYKTKQKNRETKIGSAFVMIRMLVHITKLCYILL